MRIFSLKFLVAIVMAGTFAACGVLNKKDKDEGSVPDPVASSSELFDLVTKHFAPAEHYEVKSIVTKSVSGVVTTSKTYKYEGKKKVSEIIENFSESGVLESRETRINGIGPCGEYRRQTEYFGSNPRIRAYRNTYKCNDQGKEVESRYFSSDLGEPEREISVTVYEYDASGKHLIKETETSIGTPSKVETTVKVFDSQGELTEKIESTDGSPTSRTVYDRALATEVEWSVNPATGNLDVEREYSKQLPPGRQPLVQMSSMAYSMTSLAEYRSRDNYEFVEGSCQLEGDLAQCRRTFKDLKTSQVTKSSEFTLTPIFINDAARLIQGLAWSRYVNNNRLIMRYGVKSSTESEFTDGKLVRTETVSAEFNEVGFKTQEQVTVTEASSGKSELSVETTSYDMGGFRPLQATKTDARSKQTVIYSY